MLRTYSRITYQRIASILGYKCAATALNLCKVWRDVNELPPLPKRLTIGEIGFDLLMEGWTVDCILEEISYKEGKPTYQRREDLIALIRVYCRKNENEYPAQIAVGFWKNSNVPGERAGE